MRIVTLQPGKTKDKVDIFERTDVGRELLDEQGPNFDIDGDDFVDDAAVFVSNLDPSCMDFACLHAKFFD